MSKKCHAHNRSGDACGQWAMHGQNVCYLHGGRAPQAMRKAEERIRDLEQPAISQVAFEMQHGDTSAVRFAAARWVLELLGHKVVVQQQTEHEVTIRVVREKQPIILESTSNRALSNGHTND